MAALVGIARMAAESRYRERFQRSAFLRGDYPERIRERVAEIRRRYGFDRLPPPPEPELWPREGQMILF